MSKRVHRLTPAAIAQIEEPGYYPDGAGLYLQVSEGGAKSWLFRYRLLGKARWMGLGPLSKRPLKEARTAAAKARLQLADRIDPIDERRSVIGARVSAAVKSIIFEKAAAEYIAAKEAGWKNAKHAGQWRKTLETYAEPLAKLDVRLIDTSHVMQVLEPIWHSKTETATRVRSRMELVLNWATTHGYRDGLNPARWKGHLDNLLATPNKVRKVKHHAALPYVEIGAFMVALRAQQAIGARAVEFAILTAMRTSEVFNAKWSEIDLDARVWVIPPERMKGKKNEEREHRVPLSAAAVAALQDPLLNHDHQHVFSAGKVDKPLSNMAGLQLLRRMGRPDITVHGFRSTFRDWTAEQTSYPNHLLEMALAHVISNDAEAAYRRGDMLEKRRPLMQAWAEYCDKVQQPKAKVTPIRKTSLTG